MKLHWCSFFKKYVPTSSCQEERCDHHIKRSSTSLKEMKEKGVTEWGIQALVLKKILDCPKCKTDDNKMREHL